MKIHGCLPLTGYTVCGVLLRAGEQVRANETKEVQSSHLRPIRITSIKKEVTCGNCLKTQ